MLLPVKPTSFVLIACQEFEPTLSILQPIPVQPNVRLTIFPLECSLTFIESILPLTLVEVLHIKSAKFNLALALRSQPLPVYLTLVNSPISIVYPRDSRFKVNKLYPLNIFILGQNERTLLRL